MLGWGTKIPCAAQSSQKEEKKKDNVQMKAIDKEVPSHVLSCFLPPEMIATHSQVLFFLCDPILSQVLDNETEAELIVLLDHILRAGPCVTWARTGGRQMAWWV